MIANNINLLAVKKFSCLKLATLILFVIPVPLALAETSQSSGTNDVVDESTQNENDPFRGVNQFSHGINNIANNIVLRPFSQRV